MLHGNIQYILDKLQLIITYRDKQTLHTFPPFELDWLLRQKKEIHQTQIYIFFVCFFLQILVHIYSLIIVCVLH